MPTTDASDAQSAEELPDDDTELIARALEANPLLTEKLAKTATAISQSMVRSWSLSKVIELQNRELGLSALKIGQLVGAASTSLASESWGLRATGSSMSTLAFAAGRVGGHSLFASSEGTSSALKLASFPVPGISSVLADALANLRPTMPDTPQMSEALNSLARSAISPALSQLMTQQGQLLGNTDASRGLAIKLDLPRFELSAFMSQLQPTEGSFGGLDAWRKFEDAQRRSLDGLFSDIAHRAKLVDIPPNLQDHMDLDWELVETILLDEGIPLAWVPPSGVVGQLLGASSAAERREIIGRRWRGISGACLDVINQVEADHGRVREFRKYARSAAECLRDGHTGPAQSLSANLLDSMCQHAFSKKARVAITSRGQDLHFGDYETRFALVYGALRGSFRTYWPDSGEQVPRLFSRHATAHGVSNRQMSRVNSVIALMQATSLLRLLSMMPERGALSSTVILPAA